VLQADEVNGVYAIVPTPAKEGADHWSVTNTVDVAASVEMVDKLVDDGVEAIIAMGTTGECATLTRAEWETFADAVVSTVNGRVPTFIGATALGTNEIIDRLKFVRDLGATGSMLGLPMWQPLVDEMAVRLFADVSEALPDLAIMVYMNSRAFRYEFPIEFWEQIIKVAPTVTSAKYTRSPGYLELIETTKDKIKFLPIDMGCLEYAEIAPDHMTACWSTGASMGPQPANALMEAIAARDWDKAKVVDADIKWACETFIPPNPMDFANYNIQIEKSRMAAAGYCKPGPSRPPYQFLPADFEAGAVECGRRWNELVEKYAGAR
jgi:dihydrodipicolinate synthase/N-acetylneuraminate lyase